VAKVAGRRAPTIKLPRQPLYPLAFCTEAVARLTGKEPLLTVDGLNTTSASNTVTGLIPGVTFQILAVSANPSVPVQVQITNDNASIERVDAPAFQDFVDAKKGTRTATPISGPELDARAYLCLRGWIAAGVRVPVLDPRDPAPYWLVSSRRPAELAEALRLARR